MKVALVYDRVNKWGGAERVLLALHELFPDAPLYTSVYNPATASWADVFDVRTSFLQNIPFARTSHELYALLMPLAFESFSFDEYDLVISVTSEAAKGILTKPSTLHICYNLTPTRYLWSGYSEYFANSFLRFITKPAITYLRYWDTIAAMRPDQYIAISENVAKRIRTYYKRDATVIYPPIMLEDSKKTKGSILDHGYFLIVSRLVPYKRIDIAVEAFNKLGLPLKIVGKGSEEGKLRRMAKPHITFLGTLTDAELVGYYKNCEALVFPGNEDLGLTMVEAQSFGKPVIAYKDGGALEIIAEGKSGVFFSPQTAAALVERMKDFTSKQFTKTACVAQAKKFGKEEFKKTFLSQLELFLKEKKHI